MLRLRSAEDHIEAMIETIRSDGPTDEQRAAVAYADGNAFVGAGPGTGKTYLIVERVRSLYERGVPAAKILVLTFSRRSVLELRERLTEAGLTASEIEVRTFHGFAARVIGGGVPSFHDRRLLDGLSRQMVVATAIERTPPGALTPAARASTAFRAEFGALATDLGRLPEAAREAIAENASPRLRDVLAMTRRLIETRAAIGGSDLDDLISRAVDSATAVDAPGAIWLRDRYAHVLVDEFQDTDRVQLELLAVTGGVIFAVGDEAQSIYRFRGAGNDIVSTAIRKFAMARFDLTQSRRCPPDVCNLASQAPLPKLRPLRSAHRDAGERVAVVRLRAVDDEAVYLADAIEADLNAGIPGSEIAVLLRGFRPLGPLLADELRRRSIAVASTGREALIADRRVAMLRAALDVLDRPAERVHWERLLTSRSLVDDPLAIRFAGSALDSLRLDDSLPSALEHVGITGAFSGTDVATALLHAARAWNSGDVGTAARRLVRGLRLFGAVVRDEPVANIRAAAGRVKLVCDALAGAQRTAAALGIPARCTDIVASMEAYLPELALDDAGLDSQSAGVRVLTVHASKGLQFRRVFVADAVAGRFPQGVRRSTLLEDRDRATLERYGCDGLSVDPEAAVFEEAALWYVALTRSKERLTLSFSDHGLGGDLQRPSRFIPVDRLPPSVTAVDRESLEVRGLRFGARLSREPAPAGDDAIDVPAMLDYARNGAAAFTVLASRSLRAERSMSVGNAELWLQCPRRLFYAKFARLPQDESVSLVLGAEIHRILDVFHGRRSIFDAASIDVESWAGELLAIRGQLWDDTKFESPIVASAAQCLADAGLQSYARLLGECAAQRSFVVEARERNVAVTAGRFELSGRVDRIDRLADGGRVIIDYKLGAARAGSTLKNAAKVAPDWFEPGADPAARLPLAGRATTELRLQLAFYAAATANAAEVAYVFLGGAKKPDERNGAVYVSEPFDDGLRAFTSATLEEIERDLLDPLERGRLMTLPVTSDPETCTFCPYTPICPGVRDDG